MKRSLMFVLLCLVVVVAIPAASAQAPGGYALYLPFDDGANPTANLGAPAFPGTLVGGPTFSPDIPLVDGNAKSLSFDGVDDYVTVASYPALEPAGGFTVSLWAKSVNPGTGNRYLIVKGAQDGSAGTYSLYTAGGNLYFDVFDYIGPGYSYAATLPAAGVWDGNWHNITGVYTPGAPGKVELYVDGGVPTAGSVSFAPDFNLAEDALTIGDYNPTSVFSTGLYNFTGLMDEVFFYGRALSDWEVKGLADRHAVSMVKVSGPIVAHDAATTMSASNKGEPDFAFEGAIYKGTMTVWGSISVNYKLLGPKTCTFTAGPTTTMTFYTVYTPDRVDIRNLLNGCDGNYYSIQLMERGDPLLPRGGVFITKMPGDYVLSTPYELQGPAPLPYDYYVPFDRGNVVFTNA